jgi:hypothetical protein
LSYWVGVAGTVTPLIAVGAVVGVLPGVAVSVVPVIGADVAPRVAVGVGVVSWVQAAAIKAAGPNSSNQTECRPPSVRMLTIIPITEL